MKLSQLIASEPEARVTGATDREIGQLRYDSRRVGKGDVFFAWKGQNLDGHQFIAEVCDKGAAAIVLEDDSQVSAYGPTYVVVPNARQALARMAAAYHGRPDRDLTMIGVTGTNGKTTTTFVLKHLLTGAGQRVGLIGTVGYEIGERLLPAPRTTPEGSDLHELLTQMKAADCQSVVMEVSSHALEQGRTLPIDFQVAVFTNLTQDHLDYHKTMEAYFEAKALLFLNLDRPENPGIAVINVSDPHGAILQKRLSKRVRVITYSAEDVPGADVAASGLAYSTSGTTGSIRFGGETFPLKLPLLGSFNVANALAAAAAAWGLGLEPSDLAARLESAWSAPGRLQTFTSADGVTAVVDYAHTDDAVRKVLSVLRELTRGRLVCVLGCGGNRDAAKRPLMAKAAVELADQAIFTADNPRRESVDAILDDMEAGVRGARNYIRLPDRREAIAEALAIARPGDVVCVAGKGHETTQEINGTYFPFDDRLVVQEFLARRNA